MNAAAEFRTTALNLRKNAEQEGVERAAAWRKEAAELEVKAAKLDKDAKASNK